MSDKNIKEKRTWVFTQSPSIYCMAPCSCGNEKTQWSEYDKHLWCSKCEIDFIPEHNGIFDSPVPLNIAKMMGIHFTKIDLITNDLLVLDSNNEEVKCLNFTDFYESKLIPVNIKDNIKFKIVATGKLDYELFELKNVISINPEYQLGNVLTIELIFNFPKKDTFNISFINKENKYELQETEISRLFKKYIIHNVLENDFKSEIKESKSKYKL